MRLNDIKPNDGARKAAKRLGRGDASGHGGTSTKGHKGQKARSGGYHRRGFEGGQMTLVRKTPKRGFTNIFRKSYAVVNLDQLARLPEGVEITAEALLDAGLIKAAACGVKVLGRGLVKRPLVVKLEKVSSGAREKILAAGGKIIGTETSAS